MDAEPAEMKIGELAKLTQTDVQTVRYYEQQGLLQAAGRTDGNYRVYDDSHVQRLAFIRHCRSLDMALDEVRTLLRFIDAPHESCGDVNRLLDAHIEHVAARLKELKQLERQLKALRERCVESHAARDCGILAELNSAARRSENGRSAKARGSHVKTAHAGGVRRA
jgi:Cd(II)/Pb(II)-responsive transcriptional regulator